MNSFWSNANIHSTIYGQLNLIQYHTDKSDYKWQFIDIEEYAEEDQYNIGGIIFCIKEKYFSIK